MRNRAKCKLCKDIIESFCVGDEISCKCGEITIDGGTMKYLVHANDLSNIIRIDDAGNEIIPKIVQDKEEIQEVPQRTKKDLLEMLENSIKSYENLPPQAMTSHVTNYDLCSSLMLLLAILRSD